MTRILYITSHDPSRWTRPCLVIKAFSGHRVIVEYIPPPLHQSNKIIKGLLWGSRILSSYIRFSFNYHNYDIVIFLNPYPLGWIAVHSHLFSKPLIIDYMDVNLEKNLRIPTREVDVLERAEGVIFWSKALMSIVRKAVSLKKYTYIPAGIDDEILHRLSKVTKECHWKKKEHEKIIMYFGHLWKINGVEVQGVYDLIEAFSLIEREYRDARLVFSGVIPDMELVKHLKKANVSKITFLKPVPYGSHEFTCRLNQADVLVLPTTSHPMIRYAEQHKVFIYMATKKPIVATAVPGTLGVLDESMAIFAKPNNPESLAKAITRVLENPDRAKKMAENAFKHLVRNYTWEILARRYKEFVLKIVSEL